MNGLHHRPGPGCPGVPLVAAILLLALAGCQAAPGDAAPAAPRRAALTAPAQAVCTGTDVHSRHIAVPFACATCHPAGGQFGFDPPITFTRGTTTAGGTLAFPGGVPTCTVGCHAPMGGAPHAVTWDTPGPLACTGCHDVGTLPAQHPQVLASMTRGDCLLCHDLSTHTAGVVRFIGHDAAWMNTSSPGFHAFSAGRGLSLCAGCHGADLSGGAAGVACASCHDRSGPGGAVISWKTDCTMCHGGTNDQTGAPPKTVWGQGADAVRVGAHQAHVAGGPLAAPIDCATCHVKPASALSPGHVDLVPGSGVPLATVTFSGLAANGGLLAPTWSRNAATCASTYCHGATLAGGTNKAPSWIGGSDQAACGTCHGAPPPLPHPPATTLQRCAACHGFTVDATGAVIPPAAGGKHLDGTVQITGHPLSWMDQASPNFHAYSANAGLDFCQACHGQALDGVGPPGTVQVACSSCHGAAWKTSCTMCHGGKDNLSGAPPRAQYGQAADATRVGAHTKHLAGGPVARAFDCNVCHRVPSSALDAGHVTASPTAAVVFSGVAAAGPTSAWTRAGATCTTYCHGTTLTGGSLTRPVWTAGASQGTCGTCHGIPPTSGRHWHVTDEFASCRDCHGFAYDEGSSVDPVLHIDGKKDVGNQIKTWSGGFCTSTCHGNSKKQW